MRLKAMAPRFTGVLHNELLIEKFIEYILQLGHLSHLYHS